jgi:uncharacterized protein
MDKYLLSVLVCPLCKGSLVYDKLAQELVCRFDRLAYPIRDGIPVMLDTEARKISLEEYDRLN